MDENLLSALRAGLPDCAGVALGLDRLLMLASGSRRVQDVLAFPFDSA
jgi:lysyl-tRNA synthetase class 2